MNIRDKTQNPPRPSLIREGKNATIISENSSPDKGRLGGVFNNLKFIQYNKKLISRARELRKNRTEAEIIFWNHILKNKEITNYKFTQQKPIGEFIADFYCAKLLLVIEIDGDIHEKLKGRDKERSDALLYKYGIKVIRYKNDDILNNLENVINEFKNKVKSRELYLKLRVFKSP